MVPSIRLQQALLGMLALIPKTLTENVACHSAQPQQSILCARHIPLAIITPSVSRMICTVGGLELSRVHWMAMVSQHTAHHKVHQSHSCPDHRIHSAGAPP